MLLALGLALLGFSCTATPPPTPGGYNLENIERSAPVTDAPRVDAPRYGDPFNNYPLRGGYYGGRYGRYSY